MSDLNTFDGPMPVQSITDRIPPVNPDCSVGKHHACRGDAWDYTADQSTDCTCSCHTEVEAA